MRNKFWTRKFKQKNADYDINMEKIQNYKNTRMKRRLRRGLDPLSLKRYCPAFGAYGWRQSFPKIQQSIATCSSTSNKMHGRNRIDFSLSDWLNVMQKILCFFFSVKNWCFEFQGCWEYIEHKAPVRKDGDTSGKHHFRLIHDKELQLLVVQNFSTVENCNRNLGNKLLNNSWRVTMF